MTPPPSGSATAVGYHGQLVYRDTSLGKSGKFQFVRLFQPKPILEKFQLARRECTTYLTRKLFTKFTPVQIDNGCNHYVLWGNLTRDGPTSEPKQTQKQFWDGLHDTQSPQPSRRPVVRKVDSSRFT